MDGEGLSGSRDADIVMVREATSRSNAFCVMVEAG